jgi:hypothetical protein
MTMDSWIQALCAELDVDVPVDVRLLLDVARDAAHQVERPAAPLTTFIVGYAAAVKGGGPEAVAGAAATASRLAATWPAEQPEA